jgi:ABC-type multidrug transport system ATPase subunit
MSRVLEVENLRKRYGRLQVLDGISFQLDAGQILGFLGANGAGKSTTLRILLSLVRPDSGSFRILDQRFPGGSREVYGQVGALIERADLFLQLSARENLRLLGVMQGVSDGARVREVLARVGLADRAEDRVSRFSHGMKQRLGLAQAILHRPRLLILDEPATGLDPAGMREMRTLIHQLARDEGMAVLFSSHLLSEVEQLADRVLIIDRGKQLATGTLGELFRSLPERYLEVHGSDPAALGARLGRMPGVQVMEQTPHGLRIRLEVAQAAAPAALLRTLLEEGLEVDEFRSADSLEELFLDHLETDSGRQP